MAVRHAAAFAFFAAFVQLGIAPAHAQNTPATNAPITTPPKLILPAPLPDLWLPSPKITAKCNANKTVTIDLTATFKNIGQGPAIFAAQHTVASATYGYGSGTVNLVNPDTRIVPPSTIGPVTVAPGASHTVHFSVGPLSRYKQLPSPGMYVAGVDVNPSKAIKETNLNNNGVSGLVEDPCFGK